MRHVMGLNDFMLRKEGKEVPVVYDPARCLNSHVALIGMSGSGKTHQIKQLLRSAALGGAELDIFDVHHELDAVPGARCAMYSQATGYGYNPLVLDLDPHAGGVNRQADFIVGLIKQVTTQFGSKQEAALRNLIVDCYASRGIFADNPRSWARKEISEQERRRLMDQREWQQLREYYPTLSDLLAYAETKVLSLIFGGDNKAMNALEALAKLNARLQTLALKERRAGVQAEERSKLEGQIEAQQKRCIDAYSEAIMAKPTREAKDVLKYDSKDVLVGVIQRLQILTAAGIFNATAPPFGDAKVRVHQIKSLSDEQQILFVKLRLRAIFERAKQMGPTASGTELRFVCMLDESPKYFSEDSDDIINVIAREARKFGIGLWCAAQQPNFPESFITNCGAKFILGIDASYWKTAQQRMRITEEGLKWIKPKEVMAVKLHKEGQPDPPFVNVVVPNPGTEAGRRALAKAA
ncbi:helicase HerA domain-containing protein [Pseudoxanthomonas kaohsiungensis]|uniref:Helicase HerA domain-containing protein n=2 Tax=Pseudoxanthomonas kaohsiungensis TaxID=283923 RepID=A0ABW3M153_9GAMM|nr:DUF87 domain-containing protein [Pseudoxanthomonas kaohsiungensis]